MFSSNLKKRALPWLLAPFVGKNNFIFPRTDVKSQGKARFLILFRITSFGQIDA
jgi:hypothetical protein